MTLIDRIEDLMISDDEDREKESDYLISAFQGADPQTQRVVDDCFIALCGYSLTTLLNNEKVP